MNRKFLSVTGKAFETHKATTLKELWEKAQAEGFEGLACICTLSLEKDIETRKFHAVFSSEAEDRHGEIVYQDFDLKGFKKNPVFLDSHNYDSIEHIIGRISPIAVKDGKLQGDIEFATDNPKGLLALNLAEKGFLNTTSIGFIPKQFDDKGNILKSELLEVSAVSVPANPEALFEKQHDEEQPQELPTPQPDETPSEINGRDSAEKVAIDPKRAAADAIRAIRSEQQRHLKIIARELSRITEPVARKRKIYQSLREVLKADIAA